MQREKHFSLPPTRTVLIALTVLALIALAVLVLKKDEMKKNSAVNKSAPSLIDEKTLSQLAKTSTEIDRTHLADGVTPPTNAWFSGFALQAQPKPGYNYPNSFLPSATGFEYSLPKVTASQTIINGPHSPDVVVSIVGSTQYKITRYDELTVELTYFDGEGTQLAAVRAASGLPYVYVEAQDDIDIRFTGTASEEDAVTRIESNGTEYGVNVNSTNNRFTLSKNDFATFFSAPSPGVFNEVAEHADAVVESSHVAFERENDSLLTTLRFETANNEPVFFARLPHQQNERPSAVTYESILGNMTTEVGKEFSFETPAVPVTSRLDLSAISNDERELLIRQLNIDVALFENKQDTYFGGKQLYRMAQLLMIAEQLNEDGAAEIARTTLRRELELWLKAGESEPKSFLYDPDMYGIIGNEASFGSDKEFNDHHFHYGYFIYAAAILAEHDPDFLTGHQDSINLLVADIANYNIDEQLPLRRSFDAYVGHSWASGTAPFLDGNNQESTSEAINAWVGTSLWARQTSNEALELQADWMLSQEYQTAQMYWLLQNSTVPEYLEAYGSPIVSIVWGGKREYATFFSDEPNAKLAIQLLPLSPTMKHVATPLPESVFKGTSINDTYGDHILMASPEATLDKALALPDSAIDDGNSRTYLYAYILSE